MKKAEVRPLERTDCQEDLARLPILVRSHRTDSYDADWRSSVWRWLGSHPLANEMHRWVLDADGEIVGHLAALPQYYRIDGRRVLAHTPAEYMVLPQYGFHAVTLMRKFFRTCKNCVTSDINSAVIGIQTRLGAEEAGKLQFWAKLWDVSGVAGFPKSMPLPITRLSNWGLRAVDSVLNSTVLVDGLRVEVLEGFDESFDELLEQVASEVPCVLEKDSVFLRWRYGPGSPQESATVLGVRDGESLLGYAVLWVSADGENGYLLDLTTRPARHDVARALLCEAVRYLRRLRAHNVRYRFVESSTSPRPRDMWRLGFFPGSKRRSALFVKFADSILHEMARDSTRWSYSFGDGEGTYWIR